MPKIIQSRYEQGLAAYRAGHGLIHIMEISDEIENAYRKRWDEIGSKAALSPGSDPAAIDADRAALEAGEFSRDAGPSIVAGFADGLIDDIRRITSSPALSRRGQTA